VLHIFLPKTQNKCGLTIYCCLHLPFLSSQVTSNATNATESFTMSADPLDVVGQGHTWYGYNLVSQPGLVGV